MRNRIAPLAIFTLAVSAACGLNPPDATFTGMVGTYNLVRVNGAALPAPISGGFAVRGQWILSADFNATWTEVDSAPSGAKTTKQLKGHWQLGTDVLMLPDSGAGFRMTLTEGDSLKGLVAGDHHVYHK